MTFMRIFYRLALPLFCFTPLSATADTILYQRASQLFEKPPGKFLDVFDVFSVDTVSGFTKRLTTATPGTEHDSSGARQSADGTQIVFDTYRHRNDNGNGNTAELYVAASDGSQAMRLTGNLKIDDSQPDWCGDHILFARYDFAGSTLTDIYRINPDGTGLTPVVQTSDDEYDVDCHAATGKIVFTRSVSQWHWQIVVANVDGTNPIILNTEPTYCEQPRWSEDGQWIYYSCNHHAPQVYQQEVYRMRPYDTAPQDGEGDERMRLTVSPSGSLASGPVPSPTGDRVGWTRITGPERTVFAKTIGTQDDQPIGVIDGRSFLTDWR